MPDHSSFVTSSLRKYVRARACVQCGAEQGQPCVNRGGLVLEEYEPTVRSKKYRRRLYYQAYVHFARRHPDRPITICQALDVSRKAISARACPTCQAEKGKPCVNLNATARIRYDFPSSPSVPKRFVHATRLKRSKPSAKAKS